MEDYEKGAYTVGVLAFVVTWIVAIARFGFWIGVGLGWLPATIVGIIAGFLWPVVVIGLGLGVIALVVLLNT